MSVLDIVHRNKEDYKEMLESCRASFHQSKNLLERALEAEELEDPMNRLKEITMEFCKSDDKMNQIFGAIKTLDSIDVEREVDLKAEYEKAVLELHTVDRNPEDNKIYRDLFVSADDSIQVLPSSSGRKKQAANFEAPRGRDSSVLLSQTFKPPLDPLLKTVIRDPYKSATCGHVYEGDSIRAYIAKKKGKAKCPYIGCSRGVLGEDDLVADHEMKSKIETYCADNTGSSGED